MYKVYLVTGATNGIGREIARGLARTGATVVAVGRDAARGQEVVADLRATTNNPKVELLLCDLSSQASIRSAAAELRARHDRLDVLVHQAGLFTSERKLTVDGIETMFAVNHLAYFLMTHLLLDLLKKSAPSRIIVGTGGIEAAGKIDFDDPSFTKKKWKPFTAIAQSKLGNMLFVHELVRRLEGTNVSVHAYQPGGVRTNLGAGSGSPFGWAMALVRRFGVSPEQAAAVPVRLATSPEYDGQTDTFWNMAKQGVSSARSRDPDLGARCWALSERLTGIA
jgi:NAD(P)-dependent dehydrogenase (short-subunit alcohol dehydrogenase family)